MCMHWDHTYILRDPIHHHVSLKLNVHVHTLLIIKQNYKIINCRVAFLAGSIIN